MLCLSLPLLCALLAVAGAAQASVSPCWLLNMHQYELVIARFRTAEADTEAFRVRRQADFASTREIQQSPRHALGFSSWSSIMVPLNETLERPQMRQRAGNLNRAMDLAVLTKPLSLHAAIVAEQHSAFPPAAAEPSGRTTRPRVEPNQKERL